MAIVFDKRGNLVSTSSAKDYGNPFKKKKKKSSGGGSSAPMSTLDNVTEAAKPTRRYPKNLSEEQKQIQQNRVTAANITAEQSLKNKDVKTDKDKLELAQARARNAGIPEDDPRFPKLEKGIITTDELPDEERIAREEFVEGQVQPLTQELEEMAINQPELARTFLEGLEGLGERDIAKVLTAQMPFASSQNFMFKSLGFDNKDLARLRGAKVIGMLGGALIAAGALGGAEVLGAAKLATGKMGAAGGAAFGAIIGGSNPASLGQDKIDIASQYVSEVDSAQDQLRGNLDAGMPPQTIFMTIQKQQQQIQEWEAILKQRSIANIKFKSSKEYLVLQQEIATARNNMAETLRAVENTLMLGEKDIIPNDMLYFTSQTNQSTNNMVNLK